MSRSPRIRLSFHSILIAAALAACCCSARGQVIVPRDFVGIDVQHWTRGTTDHIVWSPGWELASQPTGVESDYYWPLRPPVAQIGAFAASDKIGGRYRADLFDIAEPDRECVIKSMVVANEFFYTVPVNPVLHVHLSVDGFLESRNAFLSEAWINLYPNTWREPENYGPVAVQGLDASSQFAARVVSSAFGDRQVQNVHELLSFPVTFNEHLGGYSFSLLLGVHGWSNLNAVDSNGGAFFGNTLRIVDVTLPDGSPVPGGVTFDSGFRIPDVPEPSSAALFLLGAGMILIIVKTRHGSSP